VTEHEHGGTSHIHEEGSVSDPGAERIRVIRVLEYIGPRWWIMNTLSNNAVTKDGPRFPLGKGLTIHEVSSTELMPNEWLKQIMGGEFH
jgi:hypothetical protein